MFVADVDVASFDGPGILTIKAAQPCINSNYIAKLLHGFMPAKTSLIHGC